MNKNKKNKGLILIIILIIMFFVLKQQLNYKSQEDIIFFKLFNIQSQNSVHTNKENESYQVLINLSEERTKEKSINLLDTIDKNILIKEKVAPGMRGEFNVKLLAKKDIKYRLIFQSENEKPKNLLFSIANSGEHYDSLENISKGLIGKVNKNSETNITVNWKWDYDINAEEDKQDTEDSKKIQQYKFKILVFKE